MVFYDTISRGNYVTRQRYTVSGLPYSSRNVLGMNVGAGFFSSLKRGMSRAFSTVKNFVTNNLGQIKTVLKNTPEILGTVADVAKFATDTIGKTDSKALNKVKTGLGKVEGFAKTHKETAKKLNESKTAQAAYKTIDAYTSGKDVSINPIVGALKDDLGKMLKPTPVISTGNADKAAAAIAAAAAAPKKEGGTVRKSRKKIDADSAKLLALIEKFKN